MKKWIVANFKMFKTLEEVNEYSITFKELLDACKERVAICPSFIALNKMAEVFKGTEIMVGAQNLACEEEGAYTGEVSAKMIKSTGAEVVIIGHSERRRYYNETNEILAKKLDLAIKNDLIPIVCLADEGDLGLEETIREQLDIILKGVTSTEIVLAFEPVWAIGTGKTMANEDIEPALALIKRVAKEYLGYIPDVLYGGSVNSGNSASILALNSVDGLLVGGASKNPHEFAKICESRYE